MDSKLSESIETRDNEKRNLLILYGSETGNAEDLAKRIAWNGKRQSFCVRVKSCDDYRVGNLVNEDLVMFICSTTGQGEEPRNMTKFWKFLRRKDLPDDSLYTVHTAVIGLGDSNYLKYNFVAKKLYKRLEELGSNMIADLVLGDDQHELGPEATIGPWLNQFWKNVDIIFPPINHAKNNDQLFDSTYAVQFVDESFTKKPEKSKNQLSVSPYDEFNPFISTVISNERVTAADHFQDVRLIKLEISDDHSLRYNPGDVCSVHPENCLEDVHELISLLNLDANRKFILTKRDSDWMSETHYDHLPVPCTVFELINKYFDFKSIPKKSFFELMSYFSSDNLEKEKLSEFVSPSGQEDLYEYCNRPRRSILEVLIDFPHTSPNIPFEYLFDLIPPIKPRSFSIASALKVNPKEIHILVAVVCYKSRLKKPRLGLCSNWLAKRCTDDKVPLSIRKGTFIFNINKPIILIGPGTGVAPFRSFIQDRVNRNVKDNFLFFGCRNQNGDFYFKDEWERMHANGCLNYFVAFSRDTPEKKHYVQHLLWDERKLVWHLISKSDASIFIAGNAKQMPTQVRDTIVKIMQEFNGNCENGNAEKIVANYELNGRLQYECWS